MLRLVFYTGDRLLRVRPALPQDSFKSAYIWHGKIEFIITSSSEFTMTWVSYLPDMQPDYALALVELVGARYPLSETHHQLQTLCPEIIFSNHAQEWIFYAGTFNPWHQGHQSCIDLLPDDKLCLILPDRNPFKEERDINIVTTVLEISTKARFKKNQFLVPSFLALSGKNPTINWVKKFKTDFPDKEASLLMGFDSFDSLPKWTKASDLIPLLNTVYVVSRLEEDEERVRALDQVRSLGPELNVIFLGKHQFEHLSSTKIRDSLK